MKCVLDIMAVLLLAAGLGNLLEVTAGPHADEVCSVNIGVVEPGKALRIEPYSR